LLIAHCDCLDVISVLKGQQICKNGLIYATHPLLNDNEHYLQFCNECLKSLLNAAKNVSYTLPPVHAIANHYFVGQMSENLFHGATWVEHAMTSLVTNVVSTRIIKGGKRRAIRLHVMVFGSIPGPPATLLPRKLDDDAHFRAKLLGPFTQHQMDRIRQQHLVLCGNRVVLYDYTDVCC